MEGGGAGVWGESRLGDGRHVHGYTFRRHRSSFSRWTLWFSFWLFVGCMLAVRHHDIALSPPSASPVISLWRHDTGQLVEMDVERYLVGVLAAEMPALFHPEALKAQAVAARTYAIRALEEGRRSADDPRAVLS